MDFPSAKNPILTAVKGVDQSRESHPLSAATDVRSGPAPKRKYSGESFLFFP